MTRNVPLCGAKTRAAGGRPCKLVAGHGTPHRQTAGVPCKYHGGSTRAFAVRAADLHAQTDAERALQALRSGPIVPDSSLVDPIRALKGMLHESVVLTAYLRRQVQEKLGDEWVGGVMEYGGKDVGMFERSEEVRALVKLYNEAIDRVAKLAKTCLDAGVDAALVKLSEAQGARLTAAFRLYCQRMGFDPDMEARSRREFAAAFRELTPRQEAAS